MHGRAGEERETGRHMWTGPTRGNSVVAGDVSSSSSSISSANSFSKDGRKISVGDCALFKPPLDSPPFIGIIRCLTTGKENELKLGVSWLYRPTEVKLGKGILSEVAPNEIFYSFHKDEIPAASLLHLCKVAFLPKGVELPSGICSFVCRQVYDITNKCLWWLTDQDYINERQEEVDQLLCKTREEMHATVQQGGCSPKPTNGPTSTSQLKPSSDSVQNSASSFPSQKGKKRERGDQAYEPVKRERSSKMDDGDSGHFRPESIWKSEIAKFTEKGGLIDSEGVEKLVQLMLPERNDKRIDLAGRSILAGVVAATDKFDCLNQFVQLRGLPVFDEWLQEVHKGKIGDGSSHKDGDKSVEEFLLVLLRALDKLPVNLHALQMCNIGKSVNHLRTHKNLEIQKKARSLVDTWKKRVEAEMDARSGSNQAVSWAARPRLPDVSHGGNRHSGASSEVAMKSSAVHFSASKNAPVKAVQAETTTKSASASPGSMKSVPSSASVGNSLKEGQARNTGVTGASDLPMIGARDEKSSSSSQSHNNSQSCSSDHAKTGGVSGKEDARSSTAVSMTANKIVGGSSRHRKSVNGFQGPALSGVQKETGASRNSSLHRSQNSEKLSQSGLTSEKAIEVQMAEGNNHKLIVKIPNRGRSPAQSASGGSFDDPSVMNSRASSPVLSEKHDQFDRNLKEKNDVYRANVVSDVNNESWQSNDFKEVLTGSDEGDGSPATIPDEENCRTGDDSRKLAYVPKSASSSSGNEHKSVKLHEASYSSMDALIESCKYSEVSASMSARDDVGMNLLASVAAGEMSKSDITFPNHSPQRNVTVIERSCTNSDTKLKSSLGDNLAQDWRPSIGVNDEHEKWSTVMGTSLTKSTDDKIISLSQEKPTQLLNRHSNSSTDLQPIAEPSLESNDKSEETLPATSVAMPCATNVDKASTNADKEVWEEAADVKSNTDAECVRKEQLHSSLRSEDKVGALRLESGTEPVAVSYHSAMEMDGDNIKNMNAEMSITVQDQKPPAVIRSEFVKGTIGDVQHPSGFVKDRVSENAIDEVKVEKADETDSRSQPTEKENNARVNSVGSAVADHKSEPLEESIEGNQPIEQHSGGPAPHKISPKSMQEPDQEVRSRGSKLIGTDADDAEECTSSPADAASLPAAGGPDTEAKVVFDLNEGFNADDGRYGEPNNLRAAECSSGIQFPLPLPVSSASGGLPASITVASAAKRLFVPPEDLLKNRGELGWKGSAATSAFRPAEPRKFLETPMGVTSISLTDATAAKPGRPPLDFDLNVPDERILEDLASRGSAQSTISLADLSNNCNLQHDETTGSAFIRSCGGLDLDLNRVEEPSDMGHLTANVRRMDANLHAVKSSLGAVLNGESSVRRDFDLNDGPLVDEVSAEPFPLGQSTRNSTPFQASVSSLRLNSTEMGNFSSWFPPGNPYPAVTIQPMLPERGELPFPLVTPAGPQRMLAPHTGSAQFNPDIYRGPGLSSASAMPFPATPFQYPVFPFGTTNFPLPSATFSGGSTTYVDSSSGGRICIPTVHSQVLAPAGAVPSHYLRPFVVNLQDSCNNSGSDSSRKWGRQGLDLNAGPLGPDIEVRHDTSSLTSRQLSVASSQALAEEQSRLYQVAGGGLLKRKEPEGRWEGYKQPSWQ